MIKEAYEKAIAAAKALTQKALGQERVSQFNSDPDSKYACFFTCCFMYFRTVYKMKMSFERYKFECMKAGAMRKDFYILNRDKMAAAAGYPHLRCKSTTKNLREKIYELLLKDKPVIFSLAGRHYESIDGFELTQNGDILFTVDDPGAQGDMHCLASDLLVFRYKNGAPVYSRHPNGSKRKITTVYWFE
jgi:hypothetical protein